MRIIELSFTNINNLKGGPHRISFEEGHLSTAGIFAIVGPTGSGKSTILDVITLALFNQIPRFGKSISKSELTSLGSVITHHTDQASASITYEVNNARYTSTWSIAKNRNGKLKDYEMTIANGIGEYLDLKKSEVPGKNEQLIGLKYEQFLKSIILSQGEFSRFLKAKKNERGELLENLTGTSIYRKLGKAAYEKCKVLEGELKQKSDTLTLVSLLSDEEITQITLELSTAEKQKVELDNSIEQLRGLSQIKLEIQKAQEGIQVKVNEEKQLETELQRFEPELNKLAIHERLNPIREPLTLYKSAQHNVQETSKNLERYNIALTKANEQFSAAIQQMSALTQQSVTAETFNPVMLAFEKNVSKLDEELKYLISKGQDIRKDIDSKLLSYRITLQNAVSPTKATEELHSKRNLLLNQLSTASIAIDSDPTLLSESIQLIRVAIDILRQYISLSDQVSKLKEDQGILNRQLTDAEHEVKRLNPLIEKSKQLISTLQDNESNLLKRKDDALKIASLEEQRAQLVSGEPCPLCGSAEHPYSEHLEAATVDKILLEIESNKAKLSQETSECAQLNDAFIKANNTIVITKGQLAKVLEEQTRLNGLLADVTSSWTGKPFNAQSNSLELQQHYTQQLKQEEVALLALQQLKVVDQLIHSYDQLGIVSGDYKSKQQERTQIYPGKDPTAESNAIQNAFQAAKTSKDENQKAIEMESQDLVRAKQMAEEAGQAIKPKLVELGFTAIDELQAQILTPIQYQTITNNKEAFARRQTSIATELQGLRHILEVNTTLDKHPETTLLDINTELLQKKQQLDVLGNTIGSNTEKLKQDKAQRENQSELRNQITALQKELEKWSLLKLFIGDATGNSFANFAQGLTLQNLIVYTNKRLEHLTDRFLIDKPKGDGLLQVVDKYQGNILRSVSTLSGGETFLLSLALALSLSDMASKNVSLESLFIDEGFGTLDQETLDVALDTLEKLQSESQKTVGVISHVEALKERINVQIKLEKNAQGYSTLSIVG